VLIVNESAELAQLAESLRRHGIALGDWTRRQWTTADLLTIPYDEWHRYELIGGALCISDHPPISHQQVVGACVVALTGWSRAARAGRAIHWPGVILSDRDSVIPDVVWLSRERWAALADQNGHFRGAPELVVEVLCPGTLSERRDRDAKLKLYSEHGVEEYWIVDPNAQTVAVFRRQDAQLHLIATLTRDDTLTSEVLSDFSVPVSQLFEQD
jgi:Uma2 family endonuclease